MRVQSDSPDPALQGLRPLALILAGVAPAVWAIAGLTLGLILLVRGVLVLALSVCLSLILAPLVLACRSWPNWRWQWLCRPDWFLEPWSWLCRCWATLALDVLKLAPLGHAGRHWTGRRPGWPSVRSRQARENADLELPRQLGSAAWRPRDAAAEGCSGGGVQRRRGAAAERRGGGETRRRRDATAEGRLLVLLRFVPSIFKSR